MELWVVYLTARHSVAVQVSFRVFRGCRFGKCSFHLLTDTMRNDLLLPEINIPFAPFGVLEKRYCYVSAKSRKYSEFVVFNLYAQVCGTRIFSACSAAFEHGFPLRVPDNGFLLFCLAEIWIDTDKGRY